MKTFLEIVDLSKKKYSTSNEAVLFEIIYFLSDYVKTKEKFIQKRNEKIDFQERRFWSLTKLYFLKHKPLAHIVKKTTFLDIPLCVDKRILAPRPETEIVTKELLRLFPGNKKLSVIDICCGTGNIGIALKKYHSNIDISLLDINTRAIINTKKNLILNNIEGTTINADIFKFIKNKHNFDIVVANPPYVSKENLNKKMCCYESKISFINSKRTIDFYELLIKNRDNLLRDNNNFIMAFEIGHDQRNAIQQILIDENLEQFATWIVDYGNHDRGLIIKK